jgi:putative ABC transport system permease protein
MIDIALKNLGNRKLRTALSIVAIVAAVSLFTVLNTLVDANRDLFEGSATPFKGKVVVVEHGKGMITPMKNTVGLDSEIDINICQQIVNETENIERYEMAYVREIEDMPGGYGPEFYIIGVSNNPSYFFGEEFKIKEGNFNQGALFGSAAAERFGISSDDIDKDKNITTREGDSYQMHIGGILEETKGKMGTSCIDFAIVTNLEKARQLFGKPHSISYILITPKGNAEELSDAIESNEEWKVDALTSEDFGASIDEAVEQMDIFMGGISWVAVFIAIIMILTVFFMIAREQTKEIATLRACGAKKKWVISLFLSQSIIISFLGGIFGVIASYLVIWIWFGGGYMIPSTAMSGFLLGLIVGPIASVIPAVRASRMDPIRGLAYE